MGWFEIPVQRQYYDVKAVAPLLSPNAPTLSLCYYDAFVITLLGAWVTITSRASQFDNELCPLGVVLIGNEKCEWLCNKHMSGNHQQRAQLSRERRRNHASS